MENGLKEQITSKLETETNGNNPVIVATATLTDNGGLIGQTPELQNHPDSVLVFTANYSALRKACDLQNQAVSVTVILGGVICQFTKPFEPLGQVTF